MLVIFVFLFTHLSVLPSLFYLKPLKYIIFKCSCLFYLFTLNECQSFIVHQVKRLSPFVRAAFCGPALPVAPALHYES